MQWRKEELRRIAETDDLHVSPLREDGVTHGTPTWIWSVAVDDALSVRAYHGKKSRWYQAAPRQKAGRIIAAGMTKDVPFGARARSATLRVMPAGGRDRPAQPDRTHRTKQPHSETRREAGPRINRDGGI